MTTFTSHNRMTPRTLYCAIALASLSLSAWSGYAQYVPNPDGMFYLRAAELFSTGRWKDGYGIYQWPFYSASIAAIMLLLDVKAFLAAQVVNALLDCVAAISFVAMLRAFATDRQKSEIVICAAAVILLHPRLLWLRPVIVRDHGFIAFYAVTLYLIVKDHYQPSFLKKIGMAIAVVIAGLFRLEALFLLLLVPSFYLVARAESSFAIATIAASVFLISTLLIPGYAFWTSAYLVPHANSYGFFNDILTRMPQLFEHVSGRVQRLSEILPRGRNVGIVAYAGITAAVTFEVALRALTYPMAILAIFAFTPKRLLTQIATRLVCWFACWQFLLLLTFMAFAFFLDWRYAMAFVIAMSIPVVFTIKAVVDEWKEGHRRARYALPAVVLAVAIPGALAFPLPTKLGYLQEAGYWVDSNLPTGVKILTNDGRIAYYAGRPYEEQVLARGSPEAMQNEIANADYIVVDVGANAMPSYITPEIQSRLILAFSGANGRSAAVYRAR
jgi:hypothetical protein